MKRKLVTLLRIVAFAAVLVGWCIFYRAFDDFHRACFPELYGKGPPVSSLLLPPLLLCFILLMPVVPALEKEIEKQGKGRETLERMQEKAGLLLKEENL